MWIGEIPDVQLPHSQCNKHLSCLWRLSRQLSRHWLSQHQSSLCRSSSTTMVSTTTKILIRFIVIYVQCINRCAHAFDHTFLTSSSLASSLLTDSAPKITFITRNVKQGEWRGKNYNSYSWQWVRTPTCYPLSTPLASTFLGTASRSWQHDSNGKHQKVSRKASSCEDSPFLQT